MLEHEEQEEAWLVLEGTSLGTSACGVGSGGELVDETSLAGEGIRGGKPVAVETASVREGSGSCEETSFVLRLRLPKLG